MNKAGVINSIEVEIHNDPMISYMIPDTAGITQRWRGVECEEGWKDLIMRTLRGITIADPEKVLRIFLIKEKFGGIRIHLDHYAELLSQAHKNIIDSFIGNAENQSFQICEECGSVDVVQRIIVRGWIHVRCEKCAEKFKEEIV